MSTETNNISNLSNKLMPKPILSSIFEYLPKQDIGRAKRVCKLWNEVASKLFLSNADVKNLLPSIKFLDRTVWETHFDLALLGLSVEGECPLTQKDVLALKELASSLKIEGNKGLTVLTIPKGLKTSEWIKFSESPKSGNKPSKASINSKILGFKEFQGPVRKTYRVVMSNEILEGSRVNRNINDHKSFIDRTAKGWEMPRILPTAVLLGLTYISSSKENPTRLFLDAATYIRERYNSDHWADNLPGRDPTLLIYLRNSDDGSLFIGEHTEAPGSWGGVGAQRLL